MQKSYRLFTILSIVTALACLAHVLYNAFAPQAMLPAMDLMWICAVSLVALVIDHYAAPNAERCWPLVPVFGLVIFGALPYFAGLLGGLELVKFAVTGAVAFTVLTALYSIAADRLAAGKSSKAAPVVTGLLLFLAVQGCMGMVL